MTFLTDTGNPVLDWEEIPPFDQIEASHFVPAFDRLFAASESGIQEIEGSDIAAYNDLIGPLERIVDKLMRTWGILTHLNSVKNSPEIRSVYQDIQPRFIEFMNRLQQSEPIYKAYVTIRESNEWGSLDQGQKRIVENSIRNAELSGVGLSGEKKERYNELSQRMGVLSTRFSNNILDATKSFQHVAESKEELAGLPESYFALASQSAVQAGFDSATTENGPWVVTLDMPSYGPIQRFAKSRDLRKKLYDAYYSRATVGEMDNKPLVDEIVGIRIELAELLGFDNYAELSLSRKMAGSVETVDNFLAELLEASKPAADRDLADITGLAKAESNGDFAPLEQWDEPYWAERLRESRFDINEDALREYFPFESVLDGMFNLVQDLFDITVVAADGDVPVWHADVRYFKVKNESGTDIAHLYLDPYTRPAEKRGGAWATPAVNRSKALASEGKDVRLPVAYMSCNQTPPVGETPSLMTIREVETLFHEFGHDLQHMLTTVDHSFCAGLSMVEWDAVEIASQFMENWIYHKPTLKKLSGHYQTGESLPDDMLDKVIDARSFRAGYALTRQIYFGTFDMEVHARYQPDSGRSILEVQQEKAEKAVSLQPSAENQFYLQFGHIFAGGYAAGYYSYKWSEVLCADAFAAFLEVGLDNKEAVKEIGHRYRDTILALGGSVDPMEVYLAFRGRKPSIEPMLQRDNLV